MEANQRSGSGGSSTACFSKTAMLSFVTGIALIMFVSNTVGLLAVALVCYMIIGPDSIRDSTLLGSVMNESLGSGLDSKEQAHSKSSKTRPVSVASRSSLVWLTIPQQFQSPLFATLPAELRFHIYRELLISKSGGKVEEPDRLVDGKNSRVIHRQRVAMEYLIPDPYIDSSILMTCRRVYEEALTILYGENVFKFSHPMGMAKFRDRHTSTKWGEYECTVFTTKRFLYQCFVLRYFD